MHREFHYRHPARVGGARPGAHAGRSLGAGMEFVGHQRLFDRPDPRRLDLRASLRDPAGDWLVRAHRQRTSIAVHAIVDVSASMGFGVHRSKLHVAADFVAALGASAYRVGDTAGLAAFDAEDRADLHLPATLSRGAGSLMAQTLRACTPAAAGSGAGLAACVQRLAGREGLVFIASDFHWPLADLAPTLDALASAQVVPVVIWDPAEIAPPERRGIAALRDCETGRRRTFWLRPALRTRWMAAVDERRETLRQTFAARGLRPFFVIGDFDPDAMSNYFFEAGS